MRCTSSYTRAACASLADSYGPGAPRGATLSGYNIYPAAPELTEAQRQGSLATGLPLCWGHEADTVHIHESELGAHDHLHTTCLGCIPTPNGAAVQAPKTPVERPCTVPTSQTSRLSTGRPPTL